MNTRPIITGSPNLPLLNVHSYERYLPTAFDESMSILQKMNKVIHHLNLMGEISNSVVNQWNDLIKWILENGLSEVVSEEIDKRIADGTFDTLIYKIVGDLSLLETNSKLDMVHAINEINKIATNNNTSIGDVNQLNTDDKSSLVNAVNEMLIQVMINKDAPTSIGESTGHGTISGLKVTQQRVLSMAVDIGNSTDENIVHMSNGVRYTPKSISLPVKPSHATLNRRDIVYIDNKGVISYLDGTPSNNAIAPTLPNGSVLLAEIIVQAKDTTINDVDIIDKRDLKSLSHLLTNNKSNLVQAINEIITSLDDVINNAVGDVSNLPTKDKTSLVNSIIEIFHLLTDVIENVGDLTELPTTDKTNLVNAIIEVVRESATKNDVNTLIGDLSKLTTSDKTNLVNAIVEVVREIENTNTILDDAITDMGTLSNLPTSDKTSLVNALIELFNQSATKKDVGDLTNLSTQNKTDLVSAINGLQNNISNIDDDINKVMVNVKWFGAIGDGKTDDTQAFKNAIAYGTQKKLKILVPSGTYLITSTLIIEGDGFMSIEGDGGKERISVLKGNFNGDIFDIHADYMVSLKNLMIHHNGTSGSCVNFSDGESHQLVDCTFTNLIGNQSIMVIMHFSNYRINGCLFTNLEPLSYCIRVGKMVGKLSINSYIHNSYFAGTGKGVLIDSYDPLERVEGLKIRDNVFINTGTEQITVRTILDIDISNNMLDQSSNSAILLESEGVLVDTVRISNNYISPAKNVAEGIGINCRNNAKQIKVVNITSNRFGLGGYGIVGYDNLEGVNISDNFFAQFNHTAIMLKNTKFASIVNNHFTNNDFDISVEDGASGGEFIIANNSFKGNLNIVKTNRDKFRISNNVGYVDTKISSNTFDASTTGIKYVLIPHGINGIPNLNESTVSINGNDSTAEFSGVWIISGDTTNVTVGVKVDLGGTGSPRIVLTAKA